MFLVLRTETSVPGRAEVKEGQMQKLFTYLLRLHKKQFYLNKKDPLGKLTNIIKQRSFECIAKFTDPV